MNYMNENEIDSAVRKYRPDTPTYQAAKFLSDFRDQVNLCSDGWAYWNAPIRSAKKLMHFIQNGDGTEKSFKTAMIPIKSFYTRHGFAAGMEMPTIEIGA
jgi:hypothetical protein